MRTGRGLIFDRLEVTPMSKRVSYNPKNQVPVIRIEISGHSNKAKFIRGEASLRRYHHPPCVDPNLDG